MAASIKCEVDGIVTDEETGTKILNVICEDIKTLKAGDKIKITLPKKGAAVEGC